MPAIAHPIGLSTAFWSLAVSVFWGGNVVALKLGLATFPPFWSAFWRMLAGLVVLWAWARFQRIPLTPPPHERPLLVWLGLMFFVQITLLNSGTNLTSPAYGVVLLNSHPLFANLAGHFVASEEKLRGPRIAGLTLALAGVAYVSFGQPQPELASWPLAGNILLVASAFLLGLRSVYTRWLVQSIAPVRAVVWQVTFSLPLFLLAGLWFEPPTLRPVTWLPVTAILYQGLVVAGFCFIVWTVLLRKHSSGSLSMFAFTVPFFGILLSALLFKEAIGGRILLGAGLVTAGILIATRSAARPAPASPQEADELETATPAARR